MCEAENQNIWKKISDKHTHLLFASVLCIRHPGMSVCAGSPPRARQVKGDTWITTPHLHKTPPGSHLSTGLHGETNSYGKPELWLPRPSILTCPPYHLGHLVL